MNVSVCGLNDNNSILMLEMTFQNKLIEYTYLFFYLNLGALHSQMYIAFSVFFFSSMIASQLGNTWACMTCQPLGVIFGG